MLSALREDGRLSVSELAQRALVSRATVYLRLQRLQEAGILRGFSARVDSARLGLDVTAVVLISVRQTDWRVLQDELLVFEEVEYFAFIIGSFDAFLIVWVPDMRHLRDVVLEEVIRRPYVLPSP